LAACWPWWLLIKFSNEEIDLRILDLREFSCEFGARDRRKENAGGSGVVEWRGVVGSPEGGTEPSAISGIGLEIGARLRGLD